MTKPPVSFLDQSPEFFIFYSGCLYISLNIISDAVLVGDDQLPLVESQVCVLFSDSACQDQRPTGT